MATPINPSTATTKLPASPRVLLIEDEPIASALVTRLLDNHGFDVVVAEDGTAGIKAAEQVRPEIVILDLNLPDMHGYDVCKAIREDSDTPILVLSSDADAVRAIEYLDLGANDYTTKPFVAQDLLSRVSAMLIADERNLFPPASADPVTETVDANASGTVDIDLTDRNMASSSLPEWLQNSLAVCAFVVLAIMIIGALGFGPSGTPTPAETPVVDTQETTPVAEIEEEVVLETGVIVSEDGETEISAITVENPEVPTE